MTPRKSLLVWNYELCFVHQSLIVHLLKNKKKKPIYMLGTCNFIFKCQMYYTSFMCCSCIYINVLQTYIPMQACNIQVSEPPVVWLCPADGGIWKIKFFRSSLTLCWWTLSKNNCVLCKFQARTGFLLMVAKLTRVSSSQYLLQIYTHKISVLE